MIDISLLSKSKILDKLEKKLNYFNIPKLISFNADFIVSNTAEFAENIGLKFENKKIIVHSSAADEDGHSDSNNFFNTSLLQ